MPRTRPSYPPESYREAVELVRYGVPLKQVAADVGVNEQTLRNRRHQGEIHAGRAEGLTSDERDERPRESPPGSLQQEREILEAAAAFFARETDRR
jgi:transposase